VTLADPVNIPFVGLFVGDDGAIEPNDVMVKASDAMYTELLRWVEAMAVLRRPAD
jgi:hypothetical protein